MIKKLPEYVPVMTLRERQKKWGFTGLVLSLLFLHIRPIEAEYFKIFRRPSVQPGNQDSFQTPRSLCAGTASVYRCHDYCANQKTCSSCTCPSSRDSFTYTSGQWKCVGKSELRQDNGCSVKVKGELQSQPLLFVQTGKLYYLDLPIYQSCSYNFAQDTYYQACNGSWSVASGTSSRSRYILKVRKQKTRYRYWLSVKTDSQAVNYLQGRIIRINITCGSKNGGSTPSSNMCFLFKEPYFNRSISCPVYQVFTTLKPTPSFIPTSKLKFLPNFTLVNQTVQRTGSPSLLPTSTFFVVQTSSITNVTQHHPGGKETQSGGDKMMVISVSAAIGALLVVIATFICIFLYCKRRKRINAAKYAAALYNASQDQCSAGIYDESHINLPSSLKTSSMPGMSHSNPVYGRGQDMSITLKSPHHASSPSRLQSNEQDFADDSNFFKNESMFTDSAAGPPIKGRGNMIVAYENVIVLADKPRESVPDVETFYENPSSKTPYYHVLENPEESPSNSTFPSESNIDQRSQQDLQHFQEQEFQEFYNKRNDDDSELLYGNATSSPASNTGNMQDRNSSFEPSYADYYYPDQEYNVSSYDGAEFEEQDSNIYANSEAIRNPYGDSDEQVIVNPGYMPDDEDKLNI